MPAPEPNDLIPVTILTGFLGSRQDHAAQSHPHRAARAAHRRDRERVRRGRHRQRDPGAGQGRADRRDEQRLHLLHRARRPGAHPGRAAGQARGRASSISSASSSRPPGMADPGPVAQTFFMDEEIGSYYLLDAMLTARRRQARGQAARRFHARRAAGRIRRSHPAVQDRPGRGRTEQDALAARLRRINPRAPIKRRCTSARRRHRARSSTSAAST